MGIVCVVAADGSRICDRLIDLASQLDSRMQSLSAREIGPLEHGPAWLIRALSEYIPGARSAIVCPSTIVLRAFTSTTPDCGSARPTRRGLRPGRAERRRNVAADERSCPNGQQNVMSFSAKNSVV